jgi:DNA-binding NarL/FixJ family response regulator
MPVRILLADSQYLIVEGLKAILDSHEDIQVVADAYNVQQLTDNIEKFQPDLVVMDHNSVEFFEDKALSDFISREEKIPFLIISQEVDRARIRAILESGVNAFLTKYCDREEIVSAVFASVKGEKYFCTKVLDILIHPESEHAGSCEPTNLTAREIEIVRFIASGFKTRDIASELHLSPHTVHTHRKNILKKLGVSSGSELVLYAINTGIIKVQ